MRSIEWRKSTKSGNNGACIEVARLDDNTIGVRDSKDQDGPILRFPRDEWSAFVDGATMDEFQAL